jgi:hypothetical protein
MSLFYLYICSAYMYNWFYFSAYLYNWFLFFVLLVPTPIPF